MKTKVEWNAPLCKEHLNPENVTLTTPAGTRVTADEAARAVDLLAAIRVELQGANDRARHHATKADEHRARADHLESELTRASESIGKLRTERDEARRKLDAVRAVYAKWCGANPNPPGQSFYLLRDELSGALVPATFAERMSAGPRRQPTPTAETPVTLGMLQELTNEADRIRATRSLFGMAIDRKLGR